MAACSDSERRALIDRTIGINAGRVSMRADDRASTPDARSFAPAILSG